VACAWLIKLGVCGWVAQVNGLDLPEEPVGDDSEIENFVETVISFVRLRRNYKAVETYEQVLFLVDYVKYLRSKESYA